MKNISMRQLANAVKFARNALLDDDTYQLLGPNGAPLLEQVQDGSGKLIGVIGADGVTYRLSRRWQSGAALTNPADLTEDTLATVTIPGGSLGPNGILVVNSTWSMTNNVNNKTMKVKFGGTTFVSQTVASQAAFQHQARVRNRNAVASQVGFGFTATSFGNTTVAVITAALNTAIDRDVVFTGQLANTGDSLVLEGYDIEAIYGD